MTEEKSKDERIKALEKRVRLYRGALLIHA